MKYKVIVSGRRDFRDSDYVFHQLDSILTPIREDVVEIIHGGASGVDSIAGMYAISRGITSRTFKASWDLYGAAAGPIRNRQMAKYGNFLIAFWDGKSPGTKNMIEEATKLQVEKFIIRI